MLIYYSNNYVIQKSCFCDWKEQFTLQIIIIQISKINNFANVILRACFVVAVKRYCPQLCNYSMGSSIPTVLAPCYKQNSGRWIKGPTELYAFLILKM